MGNEQASRVVTDHRYPSGNVYSGEMRGNKRHGQGTLTWPDGAIYEGQWVNDLCEGAGRLKFPNGSVYEGGFVRNNPHGEGKLTTVNGEVLQGIFEYMGSAQTSTPAGKYNFRGEILDLKTGNRTQYFGPMALYLLSGLVSLPNMPDPMQSMLPFAIALSDGQGKDPETAKLAEEGRVLFQEGMAKGVPIAQVVQTAPTSSQSINYGQPDPALQARHPQDHATFSLLDPRLYLGSLGVPTQPANLNQRRQDEIRMQQSGQVPMPTAGGSSNPAMM